MSNLGTITSGNLVLANGNGSINFLSSLAAAPQIGVLSTLFSKCFSISDGQDSFSTLGQVTRDSGREYMTLRAPDDGDVAVLQTKSYIVSSVGASRIVTAVANLDPLGVIASHPGCVVRVGTFDQGSQKQDDQRGDGYFFQFSSAGLACVRRSSASGVDMDEVVLQAQWNMDRLDGTGLSQFTMSPTRTHALLIVYESAASASSVKLGIIAGGSVVFAHRFDHSSTDAVRTTSLPLRFELLNGSGDDGVTAELRVNSCSVSSSGGTAPCIRRSCGLRAAARELSTQKKASPVLSIRLKQEYARATAQLVGVHLTSTCSIYFEILRNGVLTGANWGADEDGEGVTELDKTATAITGGTRVASGYAAEKETLNITLHEGVPLVSDIAGVCDIYTLNIVCLMSSGLAWCTIDTSEVA